jgi:hypothetical protein
MPLSELLPNFKQTTGGEKLSALAEQLKVKVWMRKREDVLKSEAVPRHG